MEMQMLWIYIVSFSAVSFAKEFEETDDEDFIPFSGERHDRFDWNLCAALEETEPGNIIASPISVKLLLNLIYEASFGSTAKEFENILQIESRRTVTRALNNALLKTLQAPNPHYNLEIAMRMFSQKGYHPKNWYKNVLAQHYGAYITSLDFKQSALAAKEINDWVEHSTHGHIKNMIADDESLRNNILMMVSAIYFQGKWKSAFPVEDSFDDIFHSPGEPKKSRFMTQTGIFYYTESNELDAQIVRLPYEGNKFAMYVVLPRHRNGINQTLLTIGPFVLRRTLAQLEETSVSVTLPIFKFEYTMDLKDILMNIGIKSIFSNFEEFRGFKRERQQNMKQLVVSNIFQKATIVVNEQGTVAAAATGVNFNNRVGTWDLEFNANHPFLFFIEDEVSGTVIFEGKFVYPGVTSAQLEIPSPPETKPVLGLKSTFPSSTENTKAASFPNRFINIPTPTNRTKPSLEKEISPKKPSAVSLKIRRRFADDEKGDHHRRKGSFEWDSRFYQKQKQKKEGRKFEEKTRRRIQL